MDLDLKVLAEASLAVERAEAAAGEGAFTAARDELDEAERGLAMLRERWPAMGAAERALVGRSAAEVRRRADALSTRLPRVTALSDAAPEHDPEEEQDPAAAARAAGARFLGRPESGTSSSEHPAGRATNGTYDQAS
jgi:hypothetical protein